MKLRVLSAMALCFISTIALGDTKLETEQAKMSYALGATMGQHIKTQGVPVDATLFSQGFDAGYAGNASDMTEDQIHAAMMAYQKKAMELHEEQTKVVADKNKQAGEAFLLANKTKPGVITTASGLQYKVIKAGEGKSPAKTNEVEVNYEGRLIDGTVFDSSYDRGESIVFPVNAVIAGWTEALQLMKPGAEFELYIPSNLAYGSRGIGQIGPNATLLFKVELIAIK